MKKLILLSICLFCYSTSLFSQYWEDMTTLTNPPNLPQMVACDGKIYVVSGMTNNQAPSTWEYDPATSVWTEKAKIPQGCYWSSAVSVNGKIYVMGGGQPYPGKSYNLIYDPKTDIWSQGADLLTPRMYHSAASVNNKIYLIGGQNGDGTSEWYFDEYDPANDTWSRKAQSPHNEAWYCGAVGIDNSFYRIAGGGSSLSLTRDYFDKYDVNTDSWQELNRFRIKLHAPATVNYGGKIIMMGGYSYSDYRDTMYNYDPVLDNWEVMELKLPQARSYHKAAVIEDCIYVYGGQDATLAGTLIRHCHPYLSIENDQSKHDFNVGIYPNPVLEELNINIQCQYPTIADIFINNVIGENCFTAKLKLTAGENHKMISIPKLASGIYLVNLVIDGQILRTKFIK